MPSPEPESPVVPPGSLNRMIRTFARREDAERAVAVLADHDIPAAIREFWAPDTVSGTRELRGCALHVAPEQASPAARLLLKMPPSEAAGSLAPDGSPRTGTQRSSPAPTRLRRRTPDPVKQRGSIFMIGFAILCAAGFLLYAGSELMGKKRRRPPVEATDDTYTIEEDLNHDSVADVIREYSIATDQPVSWQEDRDFDGTFELRWIWQGNRLAYRDRDIDGNGKWDERTTCDPEGAPFYTDLRPDGSGPVRLRRIYRDGFLWRTLENKDGDNSFESLVDVDEGGDIIRRDTLPPDAPENAVPRYPLPPLPPRDPAEMSAPLKAATPPATPAP